MVSGNFKQSESESEASESSELLDVKDDYNLKVLLDFENDALYVGTIYLGAPQSQPARVVFDTGSEYLAVTSALCDCVYDCSPNSSRRCPLRSIHEEDLKGNAGRPRRVDAGGGGTDREREEREVICDGRQRNGAIRRESGHRL